MAKAAPDEDRLHRKEFMKNMKSASGLQKLKHPETGWIKELRILQGLTPAQLATKLGVSRQAVQKLENSEASGTIAINTLKKTAEALDCDVVYALIPRGNLEKGAAKDQAESEPRKKKKDQPSSKKKGKGKKSKKG